MAASGIEPESKASETSILSIVLRGQNKQSPNINEKGPLISEPFLVAGKIAISNLESDLKAIYGFYLHSLSQKTDNNACGS